MANYNGIFERSALGQSNDVPRTGTLDTSPDIIPFGIAVVSDPQNLFSGNYDKDIAVALQANQTNYIYLRGKNYSGNRIDDKDDSRPRLFWAKKSLLSFPATWNELTTSPSGQMFSLAADPGSIGVINEPFIWQPANIDNDVYCLIAQVPSPGYDNSIPERIENFNTWVAGHGGIAWRTISINNSTSVRFTGHMLYEQGAEGGPVEFIIACKNLPAGTKVSFSGGAPGTMPPLFLPPTNVDGPNFFVGMQCRVPANYVSRIYYNIDLPPDAIPPPDAGVSMQAWYNAGPEKGIGRIVVLSNNTLYFK